MTPEQFVWVPHDVALDDKGDTTMRTRLSLSLLRNKVAGRFVSGLATKNNLVAKRWERHTPRGQLVLRRSAVRSKRCEGPDGDTDIVRSGKTEGR